MMTMFIQDIIIQQLHETTVLTRQNKNRPSLPRSARQARRRIPRQKQHLWTTLRSPSRWHSRNNKHLTFTRSRKNYQIRTLSHGKKKWRTLGRIQPRSVKDRLVPHLLFSQFLGQPRNNEILWSKKSLNQNYIDTSFFLVFDYKARIEGKNPYKAFRLKD